MWCGCGPAQSAATRIGRPFSTDDLELGAGSQAATEFPKPGAPAATTQLAGAPGAVVMKQRQGQVMQEEPID
jgi:hypothetical protein